jgi:hypothetical protein
MCSRTETSTDPEEGGVMPGRHPQVELLPSHSGSLGRTAAQTVHLVDLAELLVGRGLDRGEQLFVARRPQVRGDGEQQSSMPDEGGAAGEVTERVHGAFSQPASMPASGTDAVGEYEGQDLNLRGQMHHRAIQPAPGCHEPRVLARPPGRA